MGGKKKYIEMFGSFTKPFNYDGPVTPVVSWKVNTGTNQLLTQLTQEPSRIQLSCVAGLQHADTSWCQHAYTHTLRVNGNFSPWTWISRLPLVSPFLNYASFWDRPKLSMQATNRHKDKNKEQKKEKKIHNSNTSRDENNVTVCVNTLISAVNNARAC